MRAMRSSLAILGSLLLCLGSTTVASEPEQPAPITFVTGTVTEAYGHDMGSEPESTSRYVRGYEVMTERPGAVLHEIVDWSDERLPRDLWMSLGYTLIWTGQDQNELDGAINHAWHSLLEDEHGRWVGTGRKIKGGKDLYSLYELTGEGAYEGLSALLYETTAAGDQGPWPRGFEGYIFEAELTPFPDRPVPATDEGQPLYPFVVARDPDAASGAQADAPADVSSMADPMAPAAFTFSLETAEEPTWGPERESDDGRALEERGTIEVQRMEATDPRASGVLSTIRNRNQLEVDDGGLQTYAFRMLLANDAGTWSGSGHGMLAFTERTLGAEGGVTVLEGDGGYEGLHLILTIPWTLPGGAEPDTPWGVIVPSDLIPPMPDPVALPAE